jgi:large subunit ribosomal protein L22
MQVKVKLSNLRVSPRKVRQVADLVRGKNIFQAQSMLSFTVKRASQSVLKLLNSAVATAKHDLHLDETNLFISAITVDEGPKLKRWHPMSRGRAFPIIKRSSHIILTLSEATPSENPTKAQKGHFDGPVTIPPRADLVGKVKKTVKSKTKPTSKKIVKKAK